MIHVHPILKRYVVSAVAVFVCLSIVEIFIIPFDLGRYSSTFEEDGVIGFLAMPSVLVFQIGYFAFVVVLLVAAIRTGSLVRFRGMSWWFGLAVAGYCLSLWGIHWASLAGMFGFGGAFIFFVFGFFPSAAFIYIVAPIIVFYSIKKRCVTSKV
jgi:hypothetical protein